jgi:outer membrane protein OmpA-like peptidoglycan-associated protein
MSAHRQRRRTRYALALAILASALSLASARADDVDDQPSPAAVQVAVQPGRPDSSRVHEPATLVDLQRRLDAISAVGTAGCPTAYQAHKAQAWVNFGRYAAAEHLPSAARAAALNNAGKLVASLEQHGTVVLDTPELPGARHVRDDLWQAMAAVKADGRVCGAPKMTAYCEVQLAWVDYEAGAGGWRHVDPHVRIAEDYCSSAIAAQPGELLTAAAARDLSAPVPDEPSDTTPTAPPAPAAAPPPPTAEPSDLSASVVFPHNRATRADIRRPGRAALKRLSKRLKSLPKNTVIMVVGHADLTGHPDYNLRLSAQRARSVAAELRSLGVHARIRLMAVGSSEPMVQCPVGDRVAERRRYLECLEPNRRVVIHLIIDAPPQAAAPE